MRVVVDLNKCQGTRSASRWLPRCSGSSAKRALAYDPNPDESQRQQVLRAVASCPVRGHHPGTGPARGPGHPVNWTYRLDEVVAKFRAEGRIAIVGASLAGLRAAEALRDKGSKAPDHHRRRAARTVRPSAAVQTGAHGPGARRSPPAAAATPGGRRLKLGCAAVGLDRANHIVKLRQREDVEYDRLLIATGTWARPWPNPRRARCRVFSRYGPWRMPPPWRRRCGPARTGSWSWAPASSAPEIASVCRDLDLAVTVAERGKGPLMGALGGDQ